MTNRSRRTPGMDARDIRLWLLPEAWECLSHIAERSECSLAEVIEAALDEWAETMTAVVEAAPEHATVYVGRFSFDSDDRP